MPDPKMAPLQITVIIRDETPLRFLQEPCRYRSVHLVLTSKQREALTLRPNEELGQVFIEERRDA